MVQTTDPNLREIPSGYMDAMHGLCITCHRERKASLEVTREDFDECAFCHGNLPDLQEAVWKDWR